MATSKKTEDVQAPDTNQVNDNQQTTADTTSSATKPNIKRGPAVSKVSERKKNAKLQQEDPEEKIEFAINTTEQFIYDNGKTLLTILGVLVLGAIIFLGYKYIYLENRAEKAGSDMYIAEQLFQEQSFDLALNGDGNVSGFLDVIDNYASTAQGNIAKHYVGVCYLKLGDLDSALDYLSKYKHTKGTPNSIINAQNLGLQGDIYVQKGDYSKAAEKFEKAVDAADNSLTTPTYLKKLGIVYSQLGKHRDAIAAFERISDQYPASIEARDIEKYIGAEEQK